MMKKLNVIKMVRTCYICPSQWDMSTDNGRQLYVRYRNGMFSVAVDDKVTGERNTIFDVELDMKKYPEPMREKTVQGLLKDVLSFDDCVYEFKD